MTHYAPVISAFVSMLLIAVLFYSKAGRTIQDVPNERSLHDTPTPRIGGVGLIAGVLAGWAVMVKDLAWWIVLPLLFLFVVSLADDARGVPVRHRLLAHVAGAVILVLGSGLAAQGVVLALIALLAAVWMTNLFNFMDGADGLAGGMAFFGFTSYGVASLMAGDVTQAMLNFSIGAAALGFLYHNFHPAKVFMGDSGSISLGFLASAMGMWGWMQGHWPVWFPPLVFAPFIVDATVTLAKRGLRRAAITEPHREHYFQRLVQMGWGHRNVALSGYILMLGGGISALWALHEADSLPWKLLLGWGGFYLGVMLVVDMRWRAHQRSVHDQA